MSKRDRCFVRLPLLLAVFGGAWFASRAAGTAALAAPPSFIRYAPDPDAIVNLAQTSSSPSYIVPAGKRWC